MASLIREAFGQTPSLLNESIFDLPLQVKLATILPVDLRLQTASVISTVTHKDFNFDQIRDQIRSKDQPFLLLVRGVALHSRRSDLDDTEIVLGAFLPHNAIPSLSRRQNACVFQLSTALLSFHCHEEELRYLLDDGAGKIQIQIPGKDFTELSLDEKAKTASLFMPRTDGRQAGTSCSIQIASIDLSGVAAGKSRLQMSLDDIFYVSDRPVLPIRI